VACAKLGEFVQHRHALNQSLTYSPDSLGWGLNPEAA
jgi:hypothetical protein